MPSADSSAFSCSALAQVARVSTEVVFALVVPNRTWPVMSARLAADGTAVESLAVPCAINPSFWSRLIFESRSTARAGAVFRQSSYGSSVPLPLLSLKRSCTSHITVGLPASLAKVTCWVSSVFFFVSSDGCAASNWVRRATLAGSPHSPITTPPPAVPPPAPPPAVPPPSTLPPPAPPAVTPPSTPGVALQAEASSTTAITFVNRVVMSELSGVAR